MEKIKEILKELDVIDNIYEAFDLNNIEINNLRKQKIIKMTKV